MPLSGRWRSIVLFASLGAAFGAGAQPSKLGGDDDEVLKAPESVLSPARPFEAPGRLGVVVLRVGAWLTEEASHLRTTQATVGVRLANRPWPHVKLDGGYRVALHQDGTHDISIVNTLHALDVRAHYAYDFGPFTATVGGGPVAYLTTVGTFQSGASQPTGVAFSGGACAALGLETLLARLGFRVEAELALRGARWDLLFSTAFGF